MKGSCHLLPLYKFAHANIYYPSLMPQHLKRTITSAGASCIERMVLKLHNDHVATLKHHVFFIFFTLGIGSIPFY